MCIHESENGRPKLLLFFDLYETPCETASRWHENMHLGGGMVPYTCYDSVIMIFPLHFGGIYWTLSYGKCHFNQCYICLNSCSVINLTQGDKIVK